MVSQNRIRLFGWACLVGGILEIVDGILYLLAFGVQTSKDAPILALLLLVANICLIGGPLGLLARRAFGSGVTGIIGKTGVGVTLVGQLCYIVGAVSIILSPAQEFTAHSFISIFLPAGAMLSTLGMLLAGIATLRGKQLRGWLAFAPLLIPIAMMLNAVSQAVFFSVTGPHANPLATIILFCFGPMWVLVGYTIQASAVSPSAATTTPERVQSSAY
jgi:hypothetical protein